MGPILKLFEERLTSLKVGFCGVTVTAGGVIKRSTSEALYGPLGGTGGATMTCPRPLATTMGTAYVGSPPASDSPLVKVAVEEDRGIPPLPL